MPSSLGVSSYLRRVCVAALLVFAGVAQSSGPGISAQCGPNAIVCENQNTGAPASEWDVFGAGDSTIQGFATEISVNRGQTVRFKVKTDASAYQIAIYRLGYYNGLGARRITTIAPSAQLPQTQPACITAPSTGLIDCGNWAESASWLVPTTATSGIYIARLSRPYTGGASHIVFVVRDDASHSDLLFQTSDTTWQAYNQYGGNSLYVGAPGTSPTRAYKVSYNRPLTTRGTTASNSVFNAEYPMVRWLEANGYDVSYLAGVDTDRSGAALASKTHKVFLSVGHDEYWSAAQRTNVENARAAGVHLAFFSGNELFWKVRWESSIDGAATPYRTLVSYKETHANAVIDPQDPPTWTGTWRDPRFSPPADGGRPENALTGTIFTTQCCQAQFPSITVPAAAAAMRFWRNTSIAANGGGALVPRVSGSGVFAGGVLGYEFDEDLDNGVRPAGLITLSSTTTNVDQRLQDYGTTYAPGTSTHSLTLYRHSSGALVFGAGTVQWSWGLDNNHERLPDATSDYTNVSLQQATVNLFGDMGAQPALLQPGLTPGLPSTDLVAPVSVITAPAAGTSLVTGSNLTISGTATDSSGRVAVVEVSIDSGATWHRANGRESWSIVLPVTGIGAMTIKSRGIDDSGNIEVPSSGVTVTRTCPCSLWNPTTATPPVADAGDASALELGVKFRSDINGFITGVRFYKSSLNTGTHVGNVYSSAGTLLTSATFVNETASGWQQVNFASPVAVTANTTYVASYHTDTGHYSATAGFFGTAFDNAPLHALANATSLNGVYQYGASAFPTSSFNASNYWVDVVLATSFTDTTPPTVTSVTPAAGATGVSVTPVVGVTFNEPMAQASITTSTVEVRNSANVAVAGVVGYNPATMTATFAPNAPLATSSGYTILVHGGTTGARVTDAAGNALATNFTSSFTTAAPVSCPCTIWNPATSTPSVVDSGDASAVELGVKFRSDVDGFISGLRYYKSAANTGTHVADLWTSAGALVATATFSGESSSGWQQVNFAAPVAISANTIYVASYHTDAGHYSATAAAFASAGADNAPLHALSNASSPNGVFRYGASGFPTSSWNASNYWVDVVFTTSPPAGDTTPPTVTGVTPAAGSSATSTALISATFSEAMNAATITSSTFDLRDGTGTLVPATVSYNAATQTATLSQSAPLAAGTTYSARVHGGAAGPSVKDTAGNALAADVAWTFTVTTGPTCPCSLWGNATVGVPDAGDASAVELGVKFKSDVDGYVTGVRYYKSAANTGVHVGTLWSSSGVRLATATFTNESSSGWQLVSFSPAVAVTANTTYVASYHTNTGHYAATGGYFAQALDSPPLHALANATSVNGVYLYGAGGFPNASFNASNYWVDVVFTTTAPQPPSGFTETSVADFSRGTITAGGYLAHAGDGEVTLAPAAGAEFDGTTMPTGWSAVSWGGATTVDVSGGALSVDGARASTDALFGVRSLEFGATFSGAPYEHVGFGLTFSETPWAIFSSGAGDALYARTNNGTVATDTPIAGNWFGSPHTFRIDWTATNVTYSVDGVVVVTHNIAVGGTLRPIASDYTGDGRPIVVQWLHLTPYAASGSFTSGVLDAAASVTWTSAAWTGSAPTGTSVALSVRFGNTATPDATWTAFTTVSNGSVSGAGRYAQYKLDLATTDTKQTPVVSDVTLAFTR